MRSSSAAEVRRLDALVETATRSESSPDEWARGVGPVIARRQTEHNSGWACSARSLCARSRGCTSSAGYACDGSAARSSTKPSCISAARSSASATYAPPPASVCADELLYIHASDKVITEDVDVNDTFVAD